MKKRHNRFLHITAIIVSTTLCVSVNADIGIIPITPLNQSGDRPTFQTGDVAAGEYTGSRETIEAEQLQRSGSSLAEIAAAQSGVQFRQSGGLGSFSTVTLRGSSAQQVNVYLDGVLLNEAAGGGVNLSDIELLDASQVDIYRGVVPVQLGNSAIGGAINITTLRAQQTPFTRLLAGLGSFGSSRFSSAWSGPVRGWNTEQLVVSFSHRRAANDFGFLNDNGTPLNPADDRDQRRNNSQSATTSGLLKTAHKLADFGQLNSVVQFFSRDQGLVDWRNSAVTSATLDTDNLQWRLSLRRAPGAAGWASLWSLNLSEKSETYDDTQGQIGLGVQHIGTDTRVSGVRWYSEKVQDGRTLALTAKLRSESLDSKDLLGITPDSKARRQQFDTALQYTRSFNSGETVANAGLFGNAVVDRYEVFNQGDTRDDYSSSSLAPQLGVSHSLNSSWIVRANLSSQRRVPSFFELFGSRGFFEGNANLRSERATNLDLALDWQSAASGKRLYSLEGVLFFGLRDDLITRNYDARGVGRSENISKARVSGLELDGHIDFRNGFEVSANITAQDARNQSRIAGLGGKQLPGQAALEGVLKTAWRNGRWRLSYDVSFARDRYYDSANFLPAEDQVLHSLSVSRVWKNWEARFEMNNLTDENFEDFNGYPKPGRAGFVSVFYKP